MSEPGGSLRVALLQTAPRLGDVQANLAGLHEQLREVTDVDLAVAPELATHGYYLGDLEDVHALPANDERIGKLGQYGPAVAVGFAEGWRHRRYNSAALVDRQRVEVQRKLWLPTYRGWEERKHFRPGGRLRCLDVRGTRVAMILCYDLWQSPLPWLAAHDGAELILVIANSVHSVAAVSVQRAWDTLIAHTAVALQTYVVFVNRSGKERGQRFWGGSTAVGPDGAELTRLGEDPGRATVEIDLAALRKLRRQWPLLQESRFDLVAREAARLAAEDE